MDAKFFPSNYPKEFLDIFPSETVRTSYVDYVGNLVSVEACIAVLGLLRPDFVLANDCIFWTSQKSDFTLEMATPVGPYTTKPLLEKYRNNFNLSAFFGKWEKPWEKLSKKEIRDADTQMLAFFAEQLSQAWLTRLQELFPNREFEFEIGMDILDEAGFCMTFSQKLNI